MNRIKELRQSLGLSQKQVAEILFVNQTAVSQWERGVTTPTKEKLIKLANIFNTSIDDLLSMQKDTIASRISQLRKYKKLSQAQLGKIVGAAQNTVCNWENGNRAPNFEMTQRLADFFNVSIDYLLGCKERTLPHLNFKNHDILTTKSSNIGSNLKAARTNKGLSQQKLANLIGVSRSTIAMWETGGSQPDNIALKQISNILQVTTDYLLDNEVFEYSRKCVLIPIFGQVIAGIPIDAVEDILGYEEISREMATHGEYFALQIKGNSMEPRMRQGDVVIVKKQSAVESGDIAVVLVNGDEATIKKFVIHDNGISLIANNEAYSPMFYTKKEIKKKPVTVLGKVVELRARF